MKNSLLILVLLTLGSFCQAQKAVKNNKKPNILVIWGDDIGQSNVSAYSHGMMGYQTPNIDRVAKEGMMFTDYYAEQSCTAGRSTFILGQSVFRTGLAKVGVPGGDEGISEDDPTIAELLKNQGYTTGQFGKNHLGDQDEHLPTNHGFDEFFGNLYHLNAEEEPELPDYPDPEKYPEFRDTYGPRDVIHSWATNTDKRKSAIETLIGKRIKENDPKNIKSIAGIDTVIRTKNQIITETGPLTKKRMETIDDESIAAAIKFIRQAEEDGEPFFVWWNGTRMHVRTHVKESMRSEPGSGLDEYSDGMIEHDMHVGQLLRLLDELDLTDNTIVQYSTDNGPHKNTWPDGATSPFRGEKNTNWEGAYRVPVMIRWPEKIEAGSISNEIVSGMDWMPTFLAAVGADANDIKAQLKTSEGYVANGRQFSNVHLDGVNILPHLLGDSQTTDRNQFMYFNDNAELTALRYADWKLVMQEQRAKGTMRVWAEPFTDLRLPLIFNLRRDPYEFATITSNTYYDWYLDHVFLFTPMAGGIVRFATTFGDVDAMVDDVSTGLAGLKASLKEKQIRVEKIRKAKKRVKLTKEIMAHKEDIKTASARLKELKDIKTRIDKLNKVVDKLTTSVNH